MKKTLLFVCLLWGLMVLQNCSTPKKATAPEMPPPETAKEAAVSFKADIMPIIQASCTPCHFPPDGRKEPLNTYAAVKANIDAVIARVKLPQTDNKFMPFRLKKPALTDSAINVLVKWKEQNMPE